MFCGQPAPWAASLGTPCCAAGVVVRAMHSRPAGAPQFWRAFLALGEYPGCYEAKWGAVEASGDYDTQL